MPDSPKDPAPGYLAEYNFINEGMRQDQRERQGFLGFTLAASGLVLGLLMNSDAERSPGEACFLVGLVAVVALAAEQLTIRASQGVATAGAYLRLFVEPHVEGLEYQGRNVRFRMKGRVSSSRGFAFAYLLVTAAFVAAWFVAPVDGRTCWQTGLVGVGAVASAYQVLRLWLASRRPQERVDSAWEEMFEEEQARKARTRPDDGVPMGVLVKVAAAVSLYHLGKLLWAEWRSAEGGRGGAPAREPADRGAAS